MGAKDQPKTNPPPKVSRTTPITIAVMLVCLAVIIATVELANLPDFRFIAEHRQTLVSGELIIFVITLVELIGRAAVVRFRKRGIESVGHSIRAILRGAVYIALTIGIVSALSSNPALAISIGTVSGIIVGFATQNLVGNVVAGMMLGIVRPVQVGDHVTVSGCSGRVKEIALLYTILDAGDNWYFVPSMAMFSNVVMRKK